MDNLRKVVALALHEVRSLAANPSMAATIFVLLFFALLFTDFFHFFEWFSVPFLCQLAVCSIGGIGTVCILAEERERGAEQTLLLSGTSRATIAAGKVIGCIIVCELVSFICAFGITRDLGRAGETALLLLFTTIPVAFISVALGMQLSDQQRASSWGAPILFCGIITATLDASYWSSARTYRSLRFWKYGYNNFSSAHLRNSIYILHYCAFSFNKKRTIIELDALNL